jgi:hypothetical protein
MLAAWDALGALGAFDTICARRGVAAGLGTGAIASATAAAAAPIASAARAGGPFITGSVGARVGLAAFATRRDLDGRD